MGKLAIVEKKEPGHVELRKGPGHEVRYMRVSDAAVYAGYSIGAMWKHIQRLHIPVSRQGKSVRVDKLEIDKWMDKNKG